MTGPLAPVFDFTLPLGPSRRGNAAAAASAAAAAGRGRGGLLSGFRVSGLGMVSFRAFKV